jgi:hypothetical protein
MPISSNLFSIAVSPICSAGPKIQTHSFLPARIESAALTLFPDCSSLTRGRLLQRFACAANRLDAPRWNL